MATKSVRFKPGMTVMINSEYTGLVFSTCELVSKFGYGKGEHVKLLKYDSSDETWRVEKLSSDEKSDYLWIKRKNLAPIPTYVENNPFKVGDKVELIDTQFNWVQSERATTGVVYEVIDEHPVSQPTPYIKIKGGDAKGKYWIESAAFKKVEPVTIIKEGVQVKLHTHDQWSIDLGLVIGEVYTVARVSKAGAGDYIKVILNNKTIGCYWIHKKQFSLVEAEEKKQKTDGTAPTTPKLQVMCMDDDLIEGWLSIGKMYDVIKKDLDLYLIKRDDNNKATWFNASRFVVVNNPDTPQITTISWAVGDTLTEDMLNYGPLLFNGLSNSSGSTWAEHNMKSPKDNYKFAFFNGDRKIDAIKMYRGRLAGLISGTMNVWVDIQSLPPIPEKEDTEGIVEMECIIKSKGWGQYITVGKTYKVHMKRSQGEGVYKVSGLDQPFNGPKGGLDMDGTLYLTIEKYFRPVTQAKTEKAPLKEFKAGDKVRFIQDKTPNSFYELATYFSKEDKLVDGKIYTVLQPCTNGSTSQDLPLRFIQLEGEKLVFNHPVDCFELVSKTKKVMCVNNSGVNFTIGKAYEVTTETVDYYKLIDNSGRPNQGMYKRRFVEITDDINNR
jgi:ribosomal protein S17